MQPILSTEERDLDAYIEEGAVRFDPDLWVVEIDDPEGCHFLSRAYSCGRISWRFNRGESQRMGANRSAAAAIAACACSRRRARARQPAI